MLHVVGIAMLVTTALSCSNDTEEPLIPVDTILEKGMIKLTDNIGEWETAVIYHSDGYILHEEQVHREYIQFLSPESDYDCCIYADKANSLPQMLQFKDGEVFYFENQGDTLITVSKATENGIEEIDNIYFSFAAKTKSSTKITSITYLDRDDKVQRVLRALNAILEAGDKYGSSQIRSLTKALNAISTFYYYEHVEEIIDELDLCRELYEETDEIIYCFTQYARKIKIEYYDPASWAICVRTDRRPVGVNSTSATVRGRIFCPSERFREQGTWGIIYSRTKKDLSLDNCEGIAYADQSGNADFTVKLEGLSPNTTYYYKTFYKFNSRNHAGLVFKYGNKDAEYYVDNDFFAGELTTQNPKLKVYLGNGQTPYHSYDGIIYYATISVSPEGVGRVQAIGRKVKGNLSGFTEYELNYLDFYNPDMGTYEMSFCDKWTCSNPTYGTDYIKFRVKTDNTYLYTDWIPFKCSSNGVQTVQTEVELR